MVPPANKSDFTWTLYANALTGVARAPLTLGDLLRREFCRLSVPPTLKFDSSSVSILDKIDPLIGYQDSMQGKTVPF